MGSLVTAYEITSKPNWKEHYDITIYQLGWRLVEKAQVVEIKTYLTELKNMDYIFGSDFMIMPFD
ncbi:hypothetical protein LEP1GSC150_2940 [Leptospira interrogans serovar Copenhageni str. LT2050]|uniref:Uncharacterized protein n=1 Tax=Leptospira interrogans serovar Copenhageni str. LT2050 TaxID=1001598 RepID=M3HFI1_LEPIT|nr:hypothetical protein LEP1GSC150_2940 [Leptospira interrogans serovar Copenhageni str. LT2050]